LQKKLRGEENMNSEFLGLHMDGLIFFDLETSGLDPKKNEIIQLAAIHAPTGDELEIKLKFDMSRAEKEALKVCGYRKKDWKDAISQREGALLFNEFLSKHKSVNKVSKRGNNYKVAMLAGYNVLAFDKLFITEWFKREDIFLQADYRMYDFYPMIMFTIPCMTDYRLENVCNELELPKRKAHDALEDVRMTIDVAAVVFDELLYNYDRQSIPKWGLDRMEELFEEEG